MNSATRRITAIINHCEDALTLIHKEISVELASDPDTPRLIHALHKAMLETHYANVEWRKYVEQLTRRHLAIEPRSPFRDD